MIHVHAVAVKNIKSAVVRISKQNGELAWRQALLTESKWRKNKHENHVKGWFQ